MNPLLLHTSRKALLAATITMVVGVVLLFVYWTAAIHGVVPSLGRPLVAGRVSTNAVTNQVAFHATAPTEKRSVPASRPEEVASAAPAKPAEDPDLKAGSSAKAPSGATTAPDSPAAVGPTKLPAVAFTNRALEAVTEIKAAPANMPDAGTSGPASLVLPDATWQDANIARRWAASTNERPVVRVFYDRSDILDLLRAGRGILVASLGDEREKKRREYCLTTPPGASAEYVAFTANHAARFAKLGIAMRKVGELARLAGPLPAYFGGETERITLEFVPDQELGRAIYLQVSRAMRAANVPPAQQTGWIYEGELRVESGRPEFVIQRVRAANREWTFNSAPGEVARAGN